MMGVSEWIDEVAAPEYLWFLKRLAANDTLANNANQAGPYVPKPVAFRLFPSLETTQTKNPDAEFVAIVDSHEQVVEARAVYYNNRYFENPKGGRDETRFTRWEGAKSPVLSSESTGALAVFAFQMVGDEAAECRVWVCRSPDEEALIEDVVGPIEPGTYLLWAPTAGVILEPPRAAERANCHLPADRLPPNWLVAFPTGDEIIRFSIGLQNTARLPVDARLLKRRTCEYELFRSVEDAHFLPRVREGYESVEAFIGVAQSILQSRKSRSGNSLELHAREIFLEEGLEAGVQFHHKAKTEQGKQPDFIFPSQTAYENAQYPASGLRMLAAKTTCKDRWRQILNEADRIGAKHLLTLQEGVSEAQFREMNQAGVTLVVPTGLRSKFKESIQPHLVSLRDFIDEVKALPTL